MAGNLRRSLRFRCDDERDIEEAIQARHPKNEGQHHHVVPAIQDRKSSNRASPSHGSQNGAAHSRSSSSLELSLNRKLLSSRESLSSGSPHRVRWSIGNRQISVSRTESESRASSVDVDSVFFEPSSLIEPSLHRESSRQLLAQSSSSLTFNAVDLPKITIPLRRRWSSEIVLMERRTISHAGLEHWPTQHVNESPIIRRDSEYTITFMQSMSRRIYSLFGARDLFDQIIGPRAVRFIPFGPAWFPIAVVIFYMIVVLLIFAFLLLIPLYFL